jgi:shikimate kinase
MPENRIVYIIGFMGSGKTTVGKELAILLGWQFIDLDKKIEEHTGEKIPEIFSKHGEEFFRNAESGMLKSLILHKDTVISTGGGTPCQDGNMDLMTGTGLTIYLRLTPGQLKSRLSEATEERPLIKDVGEENLLPFIEKKLALREKWYNQAEITVDAFNLDIVSLYSIVRYRLGI